MTAQEAKKPRSRKRLWIGAITGVVLLAAAVGLATYLRSPSFADFVRRKVVEAVEDATGGRVEMASFRWNLSQLAFEAGDITIHGLEPPGQLPYVHVDRILVRLHLISFFQRRFDVQRLELQHPVIHIIVNADGTTNAPQPKVKNQSEKTAVQELFDLAISNADVRDGMLVVNERSTPFDFAANDVVATMSYDARDRRYPGSVQIGKIDLKYQDFREIPASADLQFTLWENAIQFQSLKLTSQKSTLEANGKLTNFEQPDVQLSYNGSFDIAQLGAITRAPQLRGGTLLVNGSGIYSQAQNYAANGHVSFRDLDYSDNGFVLRRANLNSNFSFANDRLALTQIAARLLGGQVTGDAEIKNILASPTEQPKLPPVSAPSRVAKGRAVRAAAPATAGQEGSAHLRVTRLSLNELARMVSSQSLPLDKLNAVGGVTGTVNVSWRRSLADSIADLALDIAPPAQVAANQLPVSGTVRGRTNVRAERIDLTTLTLGTPHAHLDATGSLGSSNAALKLNADTDSPAELQPLLTAMGNAPLPIELSGQAGFHGTLSGRLRTPQIAGHIQATDFTYIYSPAPPAVGMKAATTPPTRGRFVASATQTPAGPQATEQPRRIHFDALSADIQCSPSNLALHNGTIQEGDAQLMVDGSAALDKGNFSQTSEFQVKASLHNGDVGQLLHAAGLNYQLQGKLTFAVQAAGTAENPHGQGQVSLAEGEFHGRPIKSLTSKIAFANHAVQLQDIHLQAARGTVAGSAGYNFRTKEGQLDLKGQSVDLADLTEVQTERLQVAGIVDFNLKGSGTLDHPVVNAHVEIAQLVLNGDVIGTVNADAVTEGKQLTLTARSKFPKAEFTLDGHVELDGDMPANAVLRFTNLDVNPFLPAKMRSQVTRHASLDGQAQLSGPLKQPRQLHGTVNIRQFSVEIEHVPVHSDGPVQLSIANETINVERFVIASEDTHFAIAGTAGLQGDRRLNLSASGLLSLKLAQSFDPDVTSYGISNVDLKIGGTAAHPVLSGRVQVEHAGVSVIDMPVGLGDLNGTLVFNQDRLEVEDLTGRMGGGRVKLGGFVTYSGTLGFNLTAEGNDIRLRYSGISITSDQSLRLNGTLQNAQLTGNVTVTRFAQIPSSDLQLLLSQASAPPSIPKPKSPLNNIHLEVRILSTPELTVETSLAKLSGDVDLRLRGTAARPVLLGRINIAEGDIKLAGTKYHLERGDLTFINPVRIDPILDVEATTRVRDYDITIGLHGTLERLNTTYRSDPPLSTDDIISLLAFGRTQQENAQGGAPSPGFSESASGALLSSALNSAVTNRVSKIFGSSTIRINPSLGGPENDPNARLTLEQQVSNDITLTYITNLARSAQEVIQFEYNINSEYTVQGIRDENGVVSFDLLIRKRRR